MKNHINGMTLTLLLATGAFVGSARGADFDWNAAVNGNWGDKAKWNNGGSFPNSTLPDNEAEIKKAAVIVTVDGNFGCFGLNFDSNMGELVIPAGKELRFNSQHAASPGMVMTQGLLKFNGGSVYGSGNQSKKIAIEAAAKVEVAADSRLLGYVVNKGAWDVKANMNVGRGAGTDPSKGQFVNDGGSVDLAVGKVLTVENATAADAFFEHKAGTLKGKGQITVAHQEGTGGKGKIRATKTTPDVTKVKAGTKLGASRGVSEPYEPGTLTFDADYEQHEGAILSVAMAGPAGTHGSGGAGLTYSNLIVTGETMLGGLVEIDLQAGFGAGLGEYFDVMTMASFPTHAEGEPQIALMAPPIFTGAGGEALTFSLLPDVVAVSGGYALRVEVIAAAIPTPGAAALAALGLAAFVRRRRA